MRRHGKDGNFEAPEYRVNTSFISQTDVGHHMRFTQCSILYGYITDVQENTTPFIGLRREQPRSSFPPLLFLEGKSAGNEVEQRIAFWCLALNYSVQGKALI